MSTLDYGIRELRPKDLHTDMLRHFNRYQEVKRCWRKVDDRWVLQDIAFVDQWDDVLRQQIVTQDWTRCCKAGVPSGAHLTKKTG